MNVLRRFAAGLLVALSAVLPAVSVYAADFMSFVPGRADATFPLGATDYFVVIPNGGSSKKVAGNLLTTRTGNENLTTKTITGSTINCASNTCTVRRADFSDLGANVGTALGIAVGSAGAFVKNNGDTLSGTFAFGTSTLSGALTLSGAYKATGLSTGTIVSGKYMGLDSSNNVVLNAGGGGTPAGSSGDLQTNSSGSFGAITPGTGVAAALATAIGATNGFAPSGCAAAGTSQTINASTHWGTFCLFNVTTASQTITLPAVSTLSANGGIAIKTVGQSVTLAPNAADAINGGSTGASVVIPPGVVAIVNTSGANAITEAHGVGKVASGTSALGTSAISSGACASVVTTSATGTATTDVITAGFNGDPTGVTGYAPSANGMLTIISYPSSDNVNFKVCNNTSASVTPGAITLNWRVSR